jgi:hypothetical protein
VRVTDVHWAALGSALLALLLVSPVLGDPAGLALGHPQADTWNHVWGFHHVAHGSWLQTDALGWPAGGRLWFIDTWGAVWTLPIQWIAGPVAAFNVAAAVNLWLAAFGAWLLARRVSGSALAASVAAVGFGAAPYLLGQLHNGISETVAVGWLPLSWWAALRLRDAPSWRGGVLLGVLVAVCTWASWYTGLFAGIGAACVVGLGLRTAPRRRALLPWAGLAGAVGAALVTPALAAFVWSLGGDALVARDPTFVWASLVGHNMVDGLAFVHPGDFHSPDLLQEFDEHLIVVVYVGWCVLLPALWAARDRRARPWLAGAAVAGVLALGPFLYLGGSYWELPGVGRIPLPFLALFEATPLFSAISHAYRFAVPLQLCMVVAASVAAARWKWAGPGLAGLVLVEFLALSPAPFPVQTARASVPAVYAALPEGAVLDLPVSLQVLDRSRYDLYQTEHGRPIPYGLNDPTPPLLDSNRLARAVIELERSSVDSVAPELPTLDLVLGRRELERAGFGAIVVHHDAYPPEMQARVVELLTVVCGPGEQVDRATWFAVSGRPAQALP